MSSPTDSRRSNNLWATLEGSVVDGRYHLGPLLSSGSYGGVFAADEVVADKMMRHLAIKLITPDSEYPERQMEELVLATSMDHPNILRCFSPGVCTLNGVRLLYLVMEMASSSLADRFIEGVMTMDETVILAQGMLSALIYLGGGDRPLVHRDLKPANILNVNGVWKLADFGLLRGIGPDRVAQTRTLLGTAEYAPPEAFDGTVSTAWDMWSLGAVLVEALTGALPFDEPSPQQLQNSILTSTANNVDQIGDPLQPIIRGCLIKERLKRWTAEEAIGVLKGTAAAPIFLTEGSLIGDNLALRKGKYPFRFKFGSADTVPELIQLCEEYPNEAQDYLANRYFVKWFGDALDDPALAREAGGCSQLHWHEPERGVELLLRELRKNCGMPFDPNIEPLSQRLDFGLVTVGEQTSLPLHYRCAARRHVWGETELVGEVPGVSVDPKFGGEDVPVEVRLNLIGIDPGYYEGIVRLVPQGLARPVSVPVTYTVMPLKIKISVSSLAFGAVEFGQITTRRIEVSTGSPNVHVNVIASVVPPTPGIEISGDFSGSDVVLNVTADCGQMEAGREYVRRIMLETSAGTFQVPMRLRVVVPHKPIIQAVIGGALLGGILAVTGRSLIEVSSPVQPHWFLSYPTGDSYDTIFRVIGSPCLAIAAGWVYRRFAAWRWPLLFEGRGSLQNPVNTFLNLFRNNPN